MRTVAAPIIMSGFRTGSCFDVTSTDGITHFDAVVTFSEPVARGNTSYVFVGEAAQQSSSRLPVALKVIANSLGGSNTSRDSREQLLLRELRAAHRLEHPNILGFIGAAVTDFHTILVSPFMANGELLGYLRHHPTADRNALIIQVAQAVKYLHTDIHMVHGSLSCAHVLVSNDGNALLLDRSISSTIAAADGRPESVSDIRFSAPELLGSDGSLVDSSHKTYATDVYAFGMTALQAFTGQSPWPGDGPQAIANKVRAGRLHPLPSKEVVGLGLSSIWWRLLCECWSYTPKKRPPMYLVLSDLSRSYKSVTRGKSLLHSIVNGPISEESTRSRAGMLKALWESEYGNQWLVADAVKVFEALGHRYREQIATGNAARLGLVRAELRFLDDILTSGSIDGAEKLATATRPLSEVLETSETDTYITFPAPLFGDAQEVYSVAFLSPKLVVAGSSDNSLRVWDIETGDTIGDPFIRHEDRVACISVSPDGSMVASGSFDRTVRVWKWNSTTLSLSDTGFVCRLGAQAQREMGRVFSLAFSPDGLYLASGGDDESLRVWDVSSGRQLAHAVHKRGAAVTSLAFAPDGARIASGSHDRTMRLWRWDARSRSLQAMKDSPPGHLAVAYSPDGSLIASGSVDHTVCIWDARAGSQAPKHTMRGHTYRVLSLAFSPNSRQLASAAQDNTVRIWDTLAGEQIGVLEGHGAPVYGVAFSPDGTRVVSCAGDGSVRVWDRISIAGQPRRRVIDKDQGDRNPSPEKSRAPVERTSSLRALSRRVTSLVRATKGVRDD